MQWEDEQVRWFYFYRMTENKGAGGGEDRDGWREREEIQKEQYVPEGQGRG